MQKPIEFMERIIRSNERNVFLISDNPRVHHRKALNDFLIEQAAFIKLFYLPSYSPDLNPDEYLNRDLKANLNNKPLGRAKGKIEELDWRICKMVEDYPRNSNGISKLKIIVPPVAVSG